MLLPGPSRAHGDIGVPLERPFQAVVQLQAHQTLGFLMFFFFFFPCSACQLGCPGIVLTAIPLRYAYFLEITHLRNLAISEIEVMLNGWSL